MIKLKGYSVHSDQGPFLQVNEDAVLVDLANKLFLLLDGFGGPASALAEEIKKFYVTLGADPDATLPFFFSPKYLLEGNALINSMHRTHNHLLQENSRQQASQGRGASCIGAAMAENLITFVSTGNCAGFLLRKDKPSLICRPDNICPEQISPASALGMFEHFHFSVNEVRVLEDDFFALFSDGVYPLLEEEEIANILGEVDCPNEEKVKKLFELANNRGNMDNQSAVFLQF